MSGTQGVVTFDYLSWIALFPELASACSEPQAQLYFTLACSYVNNTPVSVIPFLDPYGNQVRQPIIYLATAHIAKLFGSRSSDEVGRVASGSQGSVNVSLDMGTTNPNAAWWQQTQYGAAAWEAMKPFRTGPRFFPAPRPYLGVNSWLNWNSGSGLA